METAALLKELVEAVGPSGYEEGVRAVIRARFGGMAREVRTDPMGSCIAFVPGSAPVPSGGSRPVLMVTAHMDEIGLMVSQIEKGFLRVTSVGGVDPRVLFAQEVIVHSRRELPGLVVSVPPHFTDASEREKPIPLEKLFVDVGLPASDVESLVSVGDLVTLRPRWAELSGGYAACKSMDDRVGIAAILRCLGELAVREHAWDVLAVAMAQEEVGSRGAMASAFGIAPDAAIALDATFGQQPGLGASEALKMDAGPSLCVGPNFHPRLFEFLSGCAKAIECPTQVEAIPGASGTDAWHIQVSRSGVPCALMGIPIRSMHTPVEIVCLRDVERAGRLLAEAVCRLPPDFLQTLETPDALAPVPGNVS